MAPCWKASTGDACITPAAREAKQRRANRGSLPAHLPRIEQVIDVDHKACACCGGDLHTIGEDIAERLDIVPASFRVLVTRRPRYACRACEGEVVQAPAPARIVEGGLDGYAGYREIGRRNDVALAFCWSHVRRKFFELSKSSPSPTVTETLALIKALYAIEDEIRGQDPEARRAVRQEKAKPIVETLYRLLTARLALVSAKGKIAEAIRYATTRWTGLTLILEDGRAELDSNIVERAIRPIALNRKNALFAGSDDGGDNWATIASLIETAKLNQVDPLAWMTRTLECLARGHSSQELDQPMPWRFKP